MSEFPHFYDEREKTLKLKGVQKEYVLPEIGKASRGKGKMIR